MSTQDYFQIYIETISEAFKRARKIGFKKFALVKDLVDTVESITPTIQTSSLNKYTDASNQLTTFWP